MLYSKINGIFPNFSIGFPFEYYYQFQVKCSNNCNEMQYGFKKEIIYDFLLIWISIFILKTKINPTHP